MLIQHLISYLNQNFMSLLINKNNVLNYKIPSYAYTKMHYNYSKIPFPLNPCSICEAEPMERLQSICPTVHTQ